MSSSMRARAGSRWRATRTTTNRSPRWTEEQFKRRVEAVKLNLGDNDNGRLYLRFPFGAANDEQLRRLREVDIGGKFYRPVGWHSGSQDFDCNTSYPAALRATGSTRSSPPSRAGR